MDGNSTEEQTQDFIVTTILTVLDSLADNAGHDSKQEWNMSFENLKANSNVAKGGNCFGFFRFSVFTFSTAIRAGSAMI